MKTVFSSFRNAFISILCAVVVLVAVGVGIAYAVEAQDKKILDRNSALDCALADAGLDVSNITVTKQKLNQEDGEKFYEIEFFTDSYEYKYEIDATSGTVVGISIEALFDKPTSLADNRGGNPDESSAPEDEAPGQSDPQDGSGSSDDRQSGQTPENQPSGSQSGQTPENQPSSSQSGQTGSQTGQSSSQSSQISLDTAKDKALADAGLSLSDVTFTKGTLHLDDGIYVYEIEFYTASAEYEYEIVAASGIIVDKSIETFQSHHTSGSSSAAGTSGSSDTSGSAYIGVDRAKEIAVGDAGVKLSDAIFTKSVLDLDDGVYMYEIEFYTTSAEYEYEINAVTGAVLDKDVETFREAGASDATVNAGAYIGVDRAKEIAVDHAGFGLSDVIFTKTKVEREDGCTQYEIDFCQGTSEYEYCIDAFSGSILEYECGQCEHGSHGHHGH